MAAGRHFAKLDASPTRAHDMPPSREPATDIGPVRRFVSPDYTPQARTLGQLRNRIDALDQQIVALLAERALCVRDATRFKRDAFQVAAPERQAAVFARVRDLATHHETDFPGLPDIVEATYRTLVGGFIAGEGRFFHETELIQSP
jgi:isochorismate pyruvate lyase